MSTIIPFTPVQTKNAIPFQFQVNLTGPTALVSSPAGTFNVAVKWQTFGQRYYISLTDQQGNVVINNKPLIESDPTATPISLIAGYFASTLYYFPDLQQFVVNP